MKSTAIHLHRGFPIVLDGPYTKDCQEHHDWEDAEASLVAGLRSDARQAFRVYLLLTLALMLAGLTLGALAAMVHINWPSLADMGQALQALGQVGGAKQ